MLRLIPALLGAAVVAIGCSSPQPPTLGAGSTAPAPTTTEAAAPAPEPAPTTVAEPRSSATVGVRDEVFALDVTCYAPGAGDLVAVGVGEGDDGTPVDLLVQAVFGEPYVSIGVGDRLLESTLADPLVLTVDSGVIKGDRITFVEGLDLDTGEGTPAGVGFVRVECRQYESGLPGDA